MAQHDSQLFNTWTNLVSATRNELVFENRHKDYGAYQIRRNYNHSLSVALLITIGSIVLAVSIPKILELLGQLRSAEKEVVLNLDDLAVDAPPPVDPSEPPPPPPPPPPPVASTVQFVPPKVDEEAEEEQQVTIQETETQISTVTQTGTGGDEVVVIDEGNGNQVVEPVKEEIFTIVEQMPEFPGGEAELMKYVQRNIVYPAQEKDAGISGTAYVTFVVDKDGNINDVKILRGVAGGPNCDKEAMRVVKSMPPWKPGKQNGRSVSVQYNLPIKFVLR